MSFLHVIAGSLAMGALVYGAHSNSQRVGDYLPDDTAYLLYAKLAEWNAPSAMSALARAFEFGRGVSGNMAEAYKWHRAAAETGTPQAMREYAFFLARRYQDGPNNEAQARQWAEKASAKGDTKSSAWLCGFKDYQKGSAAQDTERRKFCEIAALHGDVRSMNSLGGFLLVGTGGPKDINEAYKWYKRAASQVGADGAFAQERLGDQHYYGRGVPRDYGQAWAWYEKAIGNGSAFGLSMKCFMLRNGQGVAKDEVAARRWCEMAANRADRLGMTLFAEHFEDGIGGPADINSARYWHELAAGVGSSESMFRLGYMYYTGSIARNYSTARMWYEKAAAAGHASAMNNLGVMFANGEGVPANSTEAKRWFARASEAGSASAHKNLVELNRVQQPVARSQGIVRRGGSSGCTTQLETCPGALSCWVTRC